MTPVGTHLVTIDNTAVRCLDLEAGKTIKQLGEGSVRGVLRTACSHVVTGDGHMIYQPEGHHGTQWLYLLPLATEQVQLPKESDA